MPPKKATADSVSESTLKEMFDEYTSDLKKHFAEQVSIPGGGTWVLTVTLCAAPKGRIFSSPKYL